MNKEQLYETIEAYLEGALSADARQAFEKEMADNPEMKAELELHRRLHQELGKADKAALKEQLQQIAREFSLESKGRKAAVYRLMPIWGAVAAAIIAAVIWWAWPRFTPSPGGEGPIVASDSLPGSQTSLPDSLMANEPEPKSEEVPISEPQQKIPTPSSPADPFRPNPRLEGLIAAENRDAGFRISADADAAKMPSDSFRATVAGTLRSISSTEGEHLTLYVYDNQPESFQKEHPAASLPLDLKPLNDEEVQGFGKMKNYTFEKDVEKELPPGLYYYVIKREGDNTPLFIGKVELGTESQK